jgi:hydroxymethylbilane synthase
LFVKEIEEALAGGRVDLAVHSSKDMPAVLPEGLAIAAVLPREDPRDALVLPAGFPAPAGGDGLEPLRARLGPAPRIGTSSVRRVAQLRRAFADARFEPVRGNLDTRLRKLDSGLHDAIVLASAGLKRLGFGNRISAALPAGICIPAPGQGIVAVETRAEDAGTRTVVEAVDHPPSARALVAERAVVEALGGGCQVPIGALATEDGDILALSAIVTSLDGAQAVVRSGRAAANRADALGREVAAALIAGGAGPLLDAARRAQEQGEQP